MKASDIQLILEKQNINLQDKVINLTLNSYNAESKSSFEIDENCNFLQRINKFADRNFYFDSGDFVLENVVEVSLSSGDIDFSSLSKVAESFPNVEYLYLNDIKSDEKN